MAGLKLRSWIAGPVLTVLRILRSFGALTWLKAKLGTASGGTSSRPAVPSKYPEDPQVYNAIVYIRAAAYLGDEDEAGRTLISSIRAWDHEGLTIEFFRYSVYHLAYKFVLVDSGLAAQVKEELDRQLQRYLDRLAEVTNLEVLIPLFKVLRALGRPEVEIVRDRLISIDNSMRVYHLIEDDPEGYKPDSGYGVSSLRLGKAPKVPRGVFRIDYEAGQIIIAGTLRRQAVLPHVDLVYKGRPISRLTVPGSGRRNRFRFRLNFSEHFSLPEGASLSVWAKGKPLVNLEGDTAYQVTRSPGGELPPMEHFLAQGYLLNKKGGLVSPAGERNLSLENVVERVKACQALFSDVLDQEVFLLYGTLLGVVRDQDVIMGDDDIDIGMVIEADTPEQAKTIVYDMVKKLLLAGHQIAITKIGRMFKVLVEGLWIDVFPLWEAEGMLWGYRAIKAGKNLILPLISYTIAKHTLPVPNRPEELLEAIYGKEWKVPVSGFRHAHKKSAREYLRRFHLTYGEVESLKRFAGEHGLPPNHLTVMSPLETSVD